MLPAMRKFTIAISLGFLVCLAWTSLTSGQTKTDNGAAKKETKVAPAQPNIRDKIKSPLRREEPLTKKLATPRETLRTFYFAINTYDMFPEMMEDALLCLDLEFWKMGKEEGTFLALELEKILSHLEIPLRAIPHELAAEMQPEGSLMIFDAEGFRIGIRQTEPGIWRVDGSTLKRVPAMRRLVDERTRTKPDLAGLRDGLTDPRSAFKKFIIDSAYGDFYAASGVLDLSGLSGEDRRARGPIIAQQLACVLQRRGYAFWQEIPSSPNAAPYTWHADETGRIALERVKQPDGKDAWVFNKRTVSNAGKMYEACKGRPVDERWSRLNLVAPCLQDNGGVVVAQKRPDDVPADLGSPRAVLKGFFKAMDASDGRDDRLAEALDFLDLKNIPPSEKQRVGGKLASKLEALLRKAQIDLASVPSDWNAAPQIFGENRNFKIEISRGRDGCWRFTEATLTRVPAMFETLGAKDRADRERTTYMDSARDTMMTFLSATRANELDRAAKCLDLSDINVSAQEDLGPVLAFKLKYILDRVSRIYVQEIPEDPEGPRFVAYHGKIGRVVIARKTDDPGKGQWLFTTETAEQIEPMFRQVLQGNVEGGAEVSKGRLQQASLWDTPGIWLRLHLPSFLRKPLGFLDLYQWLGLGLSLALSLLAAYLLLAPFQRLVSWILWKSGSALTGIFVSKMLRPLTWLAAAWIFFHLLAWLDLPISLANELLPFKKFLLAVMVGWLALRLVDLVRGIYTNSELLKPHRNLGDMIVPVGLQLLKTVVMILVLAYVVYQIGKGDLLTRFLTGLGVAGLAASLAAQDALKSFFGTLMLIGERAFKIGDRILVNGMEGVVEQVGFRSTRLRTNEDSLMTIPNSTVAASSIDNLGMRQARSYRTSLLVHHHTPLSKMLDMRDQLKTWLMNHSLVLPQRVSVLLNKVTDLGIEITVSLFFAPKDSGDDTRFQEGVTCEILRLTEELHIALASRQMTLLDEDVKDEAKKSKKAA
jgi:MscS family membrane protein